MSFSSTLHKTFKMNGLTLIIIAQKLKLFLIDDTIKSNTSGNAFLELADSKLLFFSQRLLCIVNFFQRSNRYFFVSWFAELKARYYTQHRISIALIMLWNTYVPSIVYQWQGKWKYLHWNARLLFSLPSTGIRTVLPLCLPSRSLDMFLGKFAKRSKMLLRPLEMSPRQPWCHATLLHVSIAWLCHEIFQILLAKNAFLPSFWKSWEHKSCI